MLSKVDQLLKNQRFLQTIECGDLDISNFFDYSITIHGYTKAGKTTAAHYLANNGLKA